MIIFIKSIRDPSEPTSQRSMEITMLVMIITKLSAISQICARKDLNRGIQVVWMCIKSQICSCVFRNIHWFWKTQIIQQVPIRMPFSKPVEYRNWNWVIRQKLLWKSMIWKSYHLISSISRTVSRLNMMKMWEFTWISSFITFLKRV